MRATGQEQGVLLMPVLKVFLPRIAHPGTSEGVEVVFVGEQTELVVSRALGSD